jgi:hypothetical protein
MNALGALGREDAKRHVRQRLRQAFENHLHAGLYAPEGRTELRPAYGAGFRSSSTRYGLSGDAARNRNILVDMSR